MGLFSRNEPVIVKKGSGAVEQLAALEALRGTLPAQAEKRLEADIRAVRAGIAGENRVLYELENSHMDMCVLQDIHLEHEGLSAQIDFLVLTPQRNFVIECKSLYGNITVNAKGEFVRTFRGRRQPQGIYSPFTQNRRHLQLIRQMKEADRGTIGRALFRGAFDDIYRSLIVLANEKTVVDDSAAPREVRECIVRADGLVAAIAAANEKMGLGLDRVPMRDVQANARWFLEHDMGPGGGDFAAKYRELVAELEAEGAEKDDAAAVLVPSEAADNPDTGDSGSTGRIAPAVANEAGHVAAQEAEPALPVCPRCGAPMVLRTAKRGERAGKQFYGCSRFPQCRGIVNVEDA